MLTSLMSLLAKKLDRVCCSAWRWSDFDVEFLLRLLPLEKFCYSVSFFERFFSTWENIDTR